MLDVLRTAPHIHLIAKNPGEFSIRSLLGPPERTYLLCLARLRTELPARSAPLEVVRKRVKTIDFSVSLSLIRNRVELLDSGFRCRCHISLPLC